MPPVPGLPERGQREFDHVQDLTFDLSTCLWVGLGIFAFTFVRYVLISGLHYLVTYHWFREFFRPHKLNPIYPGWKTIKGELKLGTLNLVNFVLFGILILYLYTAGHTRIYHEVSELGWLYTAASLPLVLVVQDAYFYWAHRLLHWKPLMKWAHGPHHAFRNPTPFAAFSVHPFEGALEVAFRPLILCLMPLHPTVIGVYVVLSFVINAMGHSGIEIFPSGWSRHPVLGLGATSTHHYVHHKYVNCHYSLYFAWWDKLMGTEHPKYHEEFERAAFPALQLPSVGVPARDLPERSSVLLPVTSGRLAMAASGVILNGSASGVGPITER
jgi:sterol desaturase/sphingolipid hydroxylase (fatty acid hydroxylase superfamily)